MNRKNGLGGSDLPCREQEAPQSALAQRLTEVVVFVKRWSVSPCRTFAITPHVRLGLHAYQRPLTQALRKRRAQRKARSCVALMA
jgi:hypothetical protein